jgi:hypothetical protein
LKFRYPGIYQTNTLANGRRKRTEDTSGGAEPLFGSLIISLRLNKLLDPILLIKNGQDGAWGSTTFQAGGELMCDKVVLGLLFVLI